MKLNKFTKKSDLFITVILVVGILAVVNFFSYKIFHRWDLTEEKTFSISEVSKDVSNELDDVVNVKVYFSKNLPSQYVILQQEVSDMLGEYATYSGGKIKVEFVDPKTLEDPERELYAIGIPPLVFDVIEKDKRQTVKGFLGISIEYEGKQEVIPMVTDISNLEYQITMAIKKVAAEDLPVIGILNSHGSLSTNNNMKIAVEKLEELYTIRQIDFSDQNEIQSDIDTLLLVGVSEEFNEDELKSIDSFLMNGGNLLVALDGVKVEDNLMHSTNETALDALLDSYGLKLNKNLVMDFNSEMVSFTIGFLPFNIRYPLWPMIVAGGFNMEKPSVSKLESVSFAWASSIDVDKEKTKDAVVSYLTKTTKNAWVQEEGKYNLDPQQRFSPSGNVGEKILALELNGKVKSAYSDKIADNARIILVGDSNFVADNFLSRAPDNLVFFQNLVDSLSFDEALINIRSKEVSSRPIKELTDKERATYRYMNVFGATILVMAFGMYRYHKRRKKKFEDEF